MPPRIPPALLDLNVGDLVFWNGNTCVHGNKINKTDITRVSLDFRVLPRENYNYLIDNIENKAVSTATMGTKFQIGGYYKEL